MRVRLHAFDMKTRRKACKIQRSAMAAVRTMTIEGPWRLQRRLPRQIAPLRDSPDGEDWQRAGSDAININFEYEIGEPTNAHKK